MSTHRNIDKICIVILVLTLLVTVVFMNGEKLGIEVIPDEDAENYTGTAYFTANDLDGTWSDNAYTTYITLSGDTAQIKGNGAYAYDGGVVITNGGWYVLSGTLTDGSITVKAYDSSKVWLRLNGVDVTCSDDACLIVDQADKVFLTLAEGSENSFTSGAEYSSDALEDNTGGAVFTHDDLTINGSGSLAITANYKHGIDVNDSLVITGGTISITAPEDGIHVSDSFRFTAADLTVEAGDDAIHSDGELYVESGTIVIPECCEGLEALTIDIAGGDITVYPSDDGFNANGGSSDAMGGPNHDGGMGPHGGMDHQGGMEPQGDTAPQGDMALQGDTAPHGGKEGEMSGDASGTTGERPGNAPPAMPAEQSGDESEATREKPENAPPAMQAEQSGDESGMTDEERTQASDEAAETYIRISGGTVTIINENGNDADGLDSNGSIYIDGGTVYISLKGDGSNSAIDYGSESGGECIVTGGTVLAFGASGMAEEFSASSTQCAVLYNLSSTVQAGTPFKVTDANGTEIISCTPECSYSSIAFSVPELTVGETYIITCGEESAEVTLDSTAVSVGNTGGMGGMHPGGRMDSDREKESGDGSMSPSEKESGDGSMSPSE